jgi:hypothetical protein
MDNLVRTIFAGMFHQHTFLIADKLIAMVIRQFVFVAQKDGFLGTGFLAKSTEDTPDKIYLINLGIPFALIVFGRFHVNGISGTGGGAQSAADAPLGTVLIPFKIMKAPVARRHFRLFAWVFPCYRSFK